MELKLKDKVALVTGASRGIGKAIALEFAREGAHIAVNCHHSVESAMAVFETIQNLGRKSIVVIADVTKPADVRRMVRKTMAEFGKIDILVNNAGIGIRKPLFEITEKFWDQHIDINLKGTFLCSQAVAREMVKRRYGKIINITSVGGARAQMYLAPYNASKGGVTLLSLALALELAPYGINVNVIGPGGIEGEKNQKLFSDTRYRKEWLKTVPLGRIGQEEDIAKAAVFFASDDAEYITGQILYIEGGKLCYVPSASPPVLAARIKAER